MEYKEIILTIIQSIVSLTVFYYILKISFNGIRAIFRYFFPKKQQLNIEFDVLSSNVDKNKQSQGVYSNKVKNNSKKIFFIILGVMSSPFILIWKILKAIYHEFTTHCPECDSEDVDELGSEEIDRYETSKKVTESLGSGKTKTKYVRCTKVKIKDYYCCNNCGHQFTEIRTEELK